MNIFGIDHNYRSRRHIMAMPAVPASTGPARDRTDGKGIMAVLGKADITPILNTLGLDERQSRVAPKLLIGGSLALHQDTMPIRSR